jgi:Spy/CpxP family protein refolding chaperone
MATQLDLTDTQKKEMQKAMEAAQASMKALSGNKDPKAFQSAMEENRKRIDAILTPKQREKMQSMVPPKGGAGMPPMGGPGMPPMGGGQ